MGFSHLQLRSQAHSDPHFNHHLLDLSIPDHGRVYVLGEKDRKLTSGELEEGIGVIAEKANVFLFVVIPIGKRAGGTGLPADGFQAVDAKLDVDVLIVAFELFEAFFPGLARRSADDAFQSVGNIAFAVGHVCRIAFPDKRESALKQRVQGEVFLCVLNSVNDHGWK